MKKRQQNMQIYFIVGAFAILCYINSLSGDFVHDDLPAIVYNRDVLGTSSIADMLLNDFWGMRMKLKESHKSYRPLTTFTFRLNRLVFGMESALWFHIVNVALHSLSSILFTRICSSVAGFKPNYALLAGIFFAVHPIHTESVSGIVGRAELLGCTFFSLSFLSYHGHKAKDPNSRSLWASIVLGGMAMLAKESGLTVFVVNLIYDFYRNWSTLKKTIQDVRWNHESYKFARRMFSVLASMTVFLLARIALLQGSLPKFSQQDNPAAFHSSFQARVLTFLYLSSFNLWLLICPSQLSHDWQMGSIPIILSIRDARNILTFLTISAIICLVYKIYNDLELQRHVPIVLGFILLVFPFVLPASNLLVTVGFVLAERILFIPSMGFCILVLYGVQLLYENMTKRMRRLLQASGFLLLCFFCLKTITRNQDWLSRESLLKSGLRVLPNNAKMHYNYANFLRDTSNFNLAKYHYRKALNLWPNYPSALNNLGTIIEDDVDMQEQHFLAAISFSDQHLNAHFNLGQLYRKTNRSYVAIQMFEKCIEISGSFVPAYLGLSKIKSGISSGILLSKALRLNEESPIVRLELADWLYANNLYVEALRHYTLGIQHESSLQTSFMAGALKTLRSLGQKERMYQFVLRWHVMKRANLDKTVTQLYLKDWSMKNEILRKAQLYEDTIMHRTNDCKSNIEVRNNRNNEDMKLFTPTPLHHETVNAMLKPHCNRSGVYISSKGTNFCDIIIPNSAGGDPLISLKMKHRIRRNKKILKLRKVLESKKSKDIFTMKDDRIPSLISLDKL